MSLEIKPLTEKYLEEISLLEENWWSIKVGYKYINNRLKRMLNNKTIPMSFTLLEQEKLLGFYELVETDKTTAHPEFTPMLANVYIKEEYRSKGYGTVLINHAIKTAKNLGFKKLYLHTKEKGLYERFGFTYSMDIVGDDNQNKRIYYKDL